MCKEEKPNKNYFYMANINKTTSIIVIVLLLGGVLYYSHYKNNTNNYPPLQQIVNTSDLEGYWFTPHSALRNLTFFADNKFNFNDGSGQKYAGTYLINDFSVTLHFEDKSQKDMALTFSKDNQQPNYYLKNNLLGEYYVKGDAGQQVP